MIQVHVFSRTCRFKSCFPHHTKSLRHTSKAFCDLKIILGVLCVKEFFGFGGYDRPVEGYLSWQHLLFVTFLMVVMVWSAAYFARRTRKSPQKDRLRVLAWAALWADGLEIFKVVLLCFRHNDPLQWLYELPLYMCSILLIAMPLAAFTRGRLQEAALDFTAIFGVVGAVMGTYFAGNNYGTYPVLCFDNVVSGLTHALSGFASLYILMSGMAGLKKRNVPLTFGIISGFCAAAYVVNRLVDCNYMFLMRGDDTPYDLLFWLMGESPVLYPLAVLGLFLLYIRLFYLIAGMFGKKD